MKIAFKITITNIVILYNRNVIFIKKILLIHYFCHKSFDNDQKTKSRFCEKRAG